MSDTIRFKLRFLSALFSGVTSLTIFVLLCVIGIPIARAHKPTSAVTDITIGLSTDGRPITAVRIGDGPRKLVLVGDTHGGPEANTYRPSTTVSIIDTATFAVVKTVETGRGAHGITINPSGTHAYITNIYGNDVAVLDLAEQQVVATIPVDAGPNGISFAPLPPAQASASQITLPMPHHDDQNMSDTQH